MRLEWNAWMCWLLHGKVAALPGQAQERGPDVRVYSCRLHLLPAYAEGIAVIRVSIGLVFCLGR